jgi:hypothetical protein
MRLGITGFKSVLGHHTLCNEISTGQFKDTPYTILSALVLFWAHKTDYQ